MTLSRRFVCNGVGAKGLVAVTGLLLSGFVLAHLSGNLLVFAGPEALNKYAAGLQSLGGLLWLARAGLLAVFITHLTLAFKLSRANRAARPQKYAFEATMEATFASRYMIHTGLLIMAFVAFHLAHYTFKVLNPAINELEHGDVYAMMVLGFSSPIVCIFYIISIAALALHLRHGLSSAFQTLGVYHPSLNGLLAKIGPTIAIVVFVGFVSIPLSVLLGCIH